VTARDFDELVRGRSEVTFTLCGRDWHLPPELPHRAMLYLDQLQSEGGLKLEPTWAQFEKLARLLWDDETVDTWLAAGLGGNRLVALIEWAFRQLGTPGGKPSGG
jgi:hypothetical protein